MSVFTHFLSVPAYIPFPPRHSEKRFRASAQLWSSFFHFETERSSSRTGKLIPTALLMHVTVVHLPPVQPSPCSTTLIWVYICAGCLGSGKERLTKLCLPVFGTQTLKVWIDLNTEQVTAEAEWPSQWRLPEQQQLCRAGGSVTIPQTVDYGPTSHEVNLWQDQSRF